MYGVMMKKLFLSCAFLLTVFANSAAATGLLVDCSDCDSDDDFLNAAYTQAIENEWLTVYVGNLISLELKKYQVFTGYTKECDSSNEPDGEGGQGVCRNVKFYNDIEENPSSDEYASFVLVADQTNKTKDLLSINSVVVPTEVVETAWEIVNASYIETKLSTYFKSAAFYDNVAENLLILAKSSTSVISNFVVNFSKPQIKFTFSDGSIAYAIATNFSYGSGMDDSFELKFVSIIDADGNVLDLTKNKLFEVGTIYNFTAAGAKGYSLFLVQLQVRNITITNGSATPSGRVTIIDCPNDVCPNPE